MQGFPSVLFGTSWSSIFILPTLMMHGQTQIKYVLMFVFQRRRHIGVIREDHTMKLSYNYFLEIHVSRRFNCGCFVMALPVRLFR
jgi:hypothetical protein